MIRHYVSLISKLALTALMVLGMLSTANATNYTAVASGNFSSSSTWQGGVAPTVILAGDVISIPSGYVVTLDNNVNFNVAATLNVDGMLESGTNATAVVMTAGNITGNGTIDVDSMSLALVSGVAFTGDIVTDHMSSWVTTFNSTADVTVNASLWVMNGILSITDGTFSMGNNSTIVIDGGSLSVTGNGTIGLTGNYNVVYEGSSSNTGIELTGSGLEDVTVDLSSGSLTLTTDVMLDGTLDLENGNLILNGNDLTIGVNGDIDATANGTINSDGNSSITINTMGNLSGDLTFGAGNNTVNNLTINLGSTSANVDLGSDVTVNGTLTLTQGTLTLNSNDLNFAVNGNFAASGTGSVVSTSGSNITITSNGSFTGGIRFNGTGNTVNNLTINLGNNTAYASLGSDLHVSGMLTLTAGRLHIWGNNLMMNAGATISGGTEDSYVITSEGGELTMNLAANATGTFHVGTMENYAPAVVIANTGSATSDIGIMVDNNVYAEATTGADLSLTNEVVDATWFMTSSVMTGVDVDVQLMWSADMEENGFDRTDAYIAHYNNDWDASQSSAATASGNMYKMSREGVAPGPMAVSGTGGGLKVNNVAGKSVKTTVYPNPATDMINFTSTEKVTGVTVYDVTGRKVKSMNADGNVITVSDLAPGYYSIQLSGEGFTSVQNFIKK
jgi:hypothetical protein